VGFRERLVLSFVLTGLMLIAADRTAAQPFALDEKIKPTELVLSDYVGTDARLKGKVAVAEVTQKDGTLYFFAKGISIFSPVVLFVETANKADKLVVSLHKNTWNTVELTGETDSEGLWSQNFKTGGDFGLKVSTTKLPAKYQIILWVGDEVDVDMQSPFKRPN